MGLQFQLVSEYVLNEMFDDMIFASHYSNTMRNFSLLLVMAVMEDDETANERKIEHGSW